jgi:glucose-6-phosphate 1-dehydrogenase
MHAAAQLSAQSSLADEPPEYVGASFDAGPLDPTTLVVFGVSGDLARRKLLPSLHNLERAGVLPAHFSIIGVSRRFESDEAFRSYARDAVLAAPRLLPDSGSVERLLARMQHVKLDFDDPEGYDRLRACLDALEGNQATPTSHCFYLSTAPEFFSVIARRLRGSGLAVPGQRASRVVLEKPFGHDLASSRALADQMACSFDESQLFRVDHYVAKETVQNILAFRFANSMFEPIWNRAHVDHIQITAAEDLGVGTRAGFYDATGALRDVVQNHMLQLLALICMEPPTSLAADAVRDEKVEVLRSVTPLQPETIAANTVRAQYVAGEVHDRRVCGYQQESGVTPGSSTETYAALRLAVDNERWAGVPIFLRTGKRLARKLTEISVQFRPGPHIASGSLGFAGTQPNQLVLAIEPNEGVSMRLGAKVAGAHTRIRPIEMAFRYGPDFAQESPDAYDRLLLDAMTGTPTLFTRGDEVTEQWAIVDPVLTGWHEGHVPMSTYAAGSQGPVAADTLLGSGREWRPIY